MASIVTAVGPPSTSRSVAARSTAARVRETRGSTSVRTVPVTTVSPVVLVTCLLMKQYDTVSY